MIFIDKHTGVKHIVRIWNPFNYKKEVPEWVQIVSEDFKKAGGIVLKINHQYITIIPSKFTAIVINGRGELSSCSLRELYKRFKFISS
jgi:hypothetical protein